jgi:hypothetical protein
VWQKGSDGELYQTPPGAGWLSARQSVARTVFCRAYERWKVVTTALTAGSPAILQSAAGSEEFISES